MSREPQPPPEPAWCVIAKTVEGASHVRADLPNQDAAAYKQRRKERLPLVLAISDGHGGAKYFRSEIGSQYAVGTAVSYLDEFVLRHIGSSRKWSEAVDPAGKGSAGEKVSVSELSVIARAVKEQVPQDLVREWTQAVRAHLRQNRIHPDDLGKLDEKQRGTYMDYATKYKDAVRAEEASEKAGRPPDAALTEEIAKYEAKLLQAYGATLLAAVVTEDYAAFWQLGDGDMLSISSDLEVTEVMPKDERLIANETTSLCTPGAVKDFRQRFMPFAPDDPKSQPALIMLSTDGYSNSYSSRQGFEKVASDLLEMMTEGEEGVANVERSLENWLRETSAGGSGDDISVGLILRRSALEEVRGTKRRREEEEKSRLEAEANAAAEAEAAAASSAAAEAEATAALEEVREPPAREAGDEKPRRLENVNIRADDSPGAAASTPHKRPGEAATHVEDIPPTRVVEE